MKRFLLCVTLSATSVQAAAERPLTAAEFEARVTGKTYSYSIDGTQYGAEEYHKNRRVTWTFLDGRCHVGEWYPQGEQICFRYEDINGDQCWTFTLNGGNIRAKFGSDPANTTFYDTIPTDEPLTCLGPEVGV